MGAVYFYHLTRRPLDETLTMLLEKARGAGWRVLVRGGDAARLDWLDERLWLGPEESFLAHGRAGGPHDARQPILLTQDAGNPNRAACLMALDGAIIAPEEAAAFERCCLIFDGADATAVESARAQWRTLTGAGVAAQYWSEDGGRWEKKAQA